MTTPKAITITLSGAEMLSLELGLRALIADRERFAAEYHGLNAIESGQRLERDRNLLGKLLRVDFRSNAILECIER